MKGWYRFENAASDPAIVDIHIIDFIGDWIDDYWGFGVTAKSFVDQLAKLDASVKTIRVHINSPGGDVFAALNIANALRDQQASKGRAVETIVDGLAASAASIIMMAGKVVRIADNAMVMVHNPWTWGVGNAANMRKLADDLDAVRNTIVATYRWHSTLTDADLVALMDAETWMDADQALEHGFATEKVEGLKAAASLNPAAISKLKVPEQFKARVDALVSPLPALKTPAAAKDVLRACKDAGHLDLAEGFIDLGYAMDDVTAQLHDAKTRRAAAEQRASEIRAACKTAKLPELADAYIAGAMPLDAVRAQLTTITAKIDHTEINTAMNADQGDHAKALPTAADIYAARNRSAAKE